MILKEVHKTSKEKRTCDKIKCIFLLAEGYSKIDTAQILLVDEDTVRNWEERFVERDTIESWLEDKYVEYSGKLTEEEKSDIEQYVTENMITDCKQVIAYVSKKYGKEFSHDGMVRLLHRLGFEYKQTVIIPGRYDAEEQKEWKKGYEKIEAGLKEDEGIVFIDGVHPQHNTVSGRAWIKKGENKEIKSNTGRQRINIQGAYNPNNQDVIIQEDESLTSENTIEFFKKIEEYYPTKSKIYVICDNARYYKNKDVKKYLEDSRLEIIYLPVYSPNLNLIERLWKLIKKKVLLNKYHATFVEFKQAIFDFLNSLPTIKEELLQFIGRKLHLFST